MDELLMRRRSMMNADHDFSTIAWDGRIWAYYLTTTADQSATLLYTTSNLGTEMEVDGVRVPIATSYVFATPGEHLVKFSIMGDLTNQFRNVSLLRKIYFPETTVGGAMDNLFYSTSYLELVRMPCTSVVPKIYSNAGTRSTEIADVEITNATSWTATFSHNNISRLTVKGTFSSMPNSAICGFNGTNNFEYIWIESPNLTTIGTNFCRYFSKANAILVMNVETPPTVSSTNFIQSAKSSLKIYVPYSSDHSILNAWKAADVWSTKASQIYELTSSGEIPT